MCVDDAFAGAGITIAKVKVIGIDEWPETGGIVPLVTARIRSTEINQRVKLFDIRQPPVVVAEVAGNFFARARIPDSRRPIFACGDEAIILWRKSDRFDAPLMVSKCLEEPAGFDIP